MRSARRGLVPFVTGLPHLTSEDKLDVLSLLAQACNIQDELRERHIELPSTSGQWSECAAGRDVTISKLIPVPPQKVYKFKGSGKINCSAEVAYDVVCNTTLVPEWDMLFKGADFLELNSHKRDNIDVGYIHVVYGLPSFVPGLTALVSDRDFVLRLVRVTCPNGVRVLSVRSAGVTEAIVGDPGPLPRTVRGHMHTSGYVVVPSGDECVLNVSLQVDPKGWIPAYITNFCCEAVPLNILRIREVISTLPAHIASNLSQLNEEQVHKSALRRQLPEIQKADALRPRPQELEPRKPLAWTVPVLG